MGASRPKTTGEASAVMTVTVERYQQGDATMSIAGDLVTETFGYDGGRQVTVYLPPSPPEGVVFTGDGQLISQWGAVLEATANLPPTILTVLFVIERDSIMGREASHRAAAKPPSHNRGGSRQAVLNARQTAADSRRQPHLPARTSAHAAP
jgi:hypothetical protein